MTIRSATPADIPTIRAIAQATWPVAYFPDILDLAQLHYMLDLLYGEGALYEVMVQRNQQFLLLNDGSIDIGFASYTSHYGERSVTHLNKLYVLPHQQSKGGGRILLDRVIAEAVKAKDQALELNVNKRNPAIRFYERMGFRIDRSEVIDIGQGYVMDDHVMVLALPKSNA